VLDAISFEKRGVPAVAVVTAPFLATGRAMAELHGMPEYPFVVVPHPFGSLTAEEVQERADAAIDRIEALLLGQPVPTPKVR
jgi:sugar/nucleoside kinase (ribokinase family)